MTLTSIATSFEYTVHEAFQLSIVGAAVSEFRFPILKWKLGLVTRMTNLPSIQKKMIRFIGFFLLGYLPRESFADTFFFFNLINSYYHIYLLAYLPVFLQRLKSNVTAQLLQICF